MSIRDKRYFRAINRILKEELQRGNLPSSKEFAWRLDQYIQENNLSRPAFNFRPVREGNTARAYDYNHTMQDVYEDLHTLYESTIDLHNLLSKNFNKFEVDKSKLEYEASILENRLKELILLYSYNGYLSTVYDVFDDMSKIDTTQTTAHINIKEHVASIPEIKDTSRKIFPDARVSFGLLPEIEKDVETVPISGKPSDALSDGMNETWQQMLQTKQAMTVAGYYYIHFTERQVLNRITLSLHGAKPTFVRIEFTPDNINWFTLPYHEEGRTVMGDYSFDFPTMEAYKIRFLLRKGEPDEESAGSDFTKNLSRSKFKYLIGVKHIGLYQLSYPKSAVLTSSVLQAPVPEGQNFSISKVSLSVEEEVPPATDIRYWIAIPPADGEEPDWKEISPVERAHPRSEQIIDFRHIASAVPVRMKIDENKSLVEYEMENYYANGIQFYKIGEVEESKPIVDSTERLYPGTHAWGMKRFAEPFADHATHVPSMSDWEKPRSYEYGYVPIEDGKPGLLLSGQKADGDKAYSYMFSSGILSEKSQEIQVAIPASSEPIAIYVNGAEVFRGLPDAKSKVPFRFDYGWNEILVLCYVRQVGNENGVTLDLNLDVRSFGANVYAQAKPMEKVTLHDLRYNVKSNDRNKYAIEVVNGKSFIILNHAVPGMEYDFFFSYVEGDAKDSILLKAEFTKSEQHSTISPKLKNYRLRFS